MDCDGTLAAVRLTRNDQPTVLPYEVGDCQLANWLAAENGNVR